MRKSRRGYETQYTGEPFELDLESPPEGHAGFVTFLNPHRLDTATAAELNAKNTREQLETFLSPEDFEAFWSEWSSVPIEETNNLIEDAMKHYGATPGKRRR